MHTSAARQPCCVSKPDFSLTDFDPNPSLALLDVSNTRPFEARHDQWRQEAEDSQLQLPQSASVLRLAPVEMAPSRDSRPERSTLRSGINPNR